MTTQALEIQHPVPTSGVAVTPMDMLDRAVQSGANVEVLTKLMDLQERWEKNQSRKAFEVAVAAAKAEIPIIKKNRHVGFESKRTDSRTDYWHEDMGEIARTVNPILSAHGLSYRYRSKQEGSKLRVTCVLAHRDGFFEEVELEGPNDATGNKNAHQQVGSAATYLQRQTLKLALGLAAARDDDGSAAGVAAKISDDEAQNIRDMLAAAGADVGKFLRWAKVETIEDIPADHYDSCVDAIKAVKKEKAPK